MFSARCRFVLSVLFAAVLVGTTACTTLPPLTAQERAAITGLTVRNGLGDKVEYVKIGTTVFNNKSDDFSDASVYELFVSELTAALATKGYAVTADAARATYVISLTPSFISNQPSGYGINGAGFFVHTAFGMNPGISAQVSVRVELQDPRSGRVRQRTVVQRIVQSGVFTIHGSWEEFSKHEQDGMLLALRSALKQAAAEAVVQAGL